jgi:hypothetical protein
MTKTYKSAPGEPDVGVIPEEFTVEWNGKRYAVNPNAENLPHLPYDRRLDPLQRILGPSNYYMTRVSGKDRDWINSYYRAQFVYVREGKPVIPEFDIESMTAEDINVLADVPITGGFDVGGGTLCPAGIVGQRHPNGIYLVHAELSLSSTGIDKFGTEFRLMLNKEFATATDQRGNERELQLGMFYGDPAGRQRDQIFEWVVFDHLKSKGLPVKSAPTNDIQSRIDAIKGPMMRTERIGDMSRPGILINRRRCPRLVKGLAGEYRYRRIQTGGTERYSEKPDKNDASHCVDALGYWLSGMGEIKTLRGRDRKNDEQVDQRRATDYRDDYDEFGDNR